MLWSKIFIVFIFSMLLSKLSFASNFSVSEDQRTKYDAVNGLKTIDDRASEWGLSKKEWVRYLELKNGRRGFWSPTLDPIEVLGIESRSQAERVRYAELHARLHWERTDRELRFERERRAAVNRLYPNVPIIDRSLLPKGAFKAERMQTDKAVFEVGDRIIAFLNKDLNSKNIIHKLVTGATVITGGRVDLYPVGIEKEDDVREWAFKQGVNPQQVRDRVVSINIENGMRKKFSTSEDDIQVFVRRSGEYLRINHILL